MLLEAVGVEAGGEPADFGGGHPVVHRGSLGEVADAAADREAVAAAVEAENADFAVGRFGEAEHETDGCGFAGTVLAEQAKTTPGGTVSVTLSRAVWLPYCFVTLVSSTTADMCASIFSE